MDNESDQIRNRLFFTADDLSRILGISRQSTWVLCNRRVKSGRFIRLKNNFYILEENWRALTQEGFFKVANFLQAPSYISLLTALIIPLKISRFWAWFKNRLFRVTGRDGSPSHPLCMAGNGRPGGASLPIYV